MSLKTVLFDLDGTLLPMDQDEFTKGYFKYLAAKVAPLGYEPKKLVDGIWAGTASMVKNDGSKTNEKVFWETFCQIFSPSALDDEPVFEEFYRTDFKKAKQFCGFNPKAVEAVNKIKEMGLQMTLATNPIFPRVGTLNRIEWAGINVEDFLQVTTYENSHYSKPNPMYYQEILDTLNLDPSECLMVGNDVKEDTAATKVGINTFIVTDCLINKDNVDLSQIPHGSFDDLIEYIKTLL